MMVNKERIWQRIMQLAEISEKDKPYTRRAFTKSYLQARDLLKSFFTEAGLETSLSPAANLIAKRKGKNIDLPAIALGSHIDTVLEGGRFDGIAGVITAIELAQVIQENKIGLNHPLEIIDFLSEEPSDYGLSCIGSRGHNASLSKEHLSMQNEVGESLGEAMQSMGANLDQVLTWQAPNYKAFLELHIEQAKRLERSNTDIGIVTGFAGIWRYSISIEGQTDHAGATPMNDRKDALVAASRLIQACQETALNDNSDLVATVGQLELRPNAVNAVPGSVRFSLEIRCLDASKKERILNELSKNAKQMQEFGLINSFQIKSISEVAPASCDKTLQEIFLKACEAKQYSHLALSSGAGHDAYHINSIAPSAMIFIPSKHGRSHTPDEYSSPEQLAIGAEVLLDAVMQLDRDTDYSSKKQCTGD